MIVGETLLHEYGPTILSPFDPSLVNPASVDIRVGAEVWREHPSKEWERVALDDDPSRAYTLQPGEFVLVSTYEHITIPQGLAMELKLKSSRAREGFDHSLAFWVDPGWSGILTMEVRNNRRYRGLALWKGLKFAQCIFHMVAGGGVYEGHYQHASSAQLSVGGVV